MVTRRTESLRQVLQEMAEAQRRTQQAQLETIERLVLAAELKDEDTGLHKVATVFGIVAGLAQTIGFLRWPFLVPFLSEAYLAPGASEAQQAAAAMVFEAFHRYAGMAVGEHLGYLSTSMWTFLVALLMLRSQRFGRWLGLSGMALALARAAEPACVAALTADAAIPRHEAGSQRPAR